MRNLIAIILALAVQAAECAAETWELVKPDKLGFSVEFPGKPEYSETSDDLGNGRKGMIRTYVIKSPAAVFDVTIWDLPEEATAPENVSQFLDNFRERNLDGISAKLRTEAKIEIGGQPARDVIADVMGMVWRGRMVIAGNRLYQVVAIISKDSEHSVTTEKYLSSFKLLGEAAGGAGK